MKNKLFKNALSSFVSYGVLLVFSIVASKFVLSGYGSEVNGLLSSVNQLFSYVALVEAGIGTATLMALYRPLAENSEANVVKILAASKQYFRNGAKWYLAVVVALSFVWPLLLTTTIPYWTISVLIFFQGVAGVITFWYTSPIAYYFTASGSNYINNNIHVCGMLATYGIKLIICLAEWNIIWMSVSLIAVNIIKCIVYRHYMKLKCPEFYTASESDISLLTQRKYFLIHEISGVIFASTDTVIISLFCGLKEASVYAVYALVFGSLESIIGHVFNGTNFLLGRKFSEDRKSYLQVHDRYNSVYIIAVFTIYTVAYLMILPFLALYTDGVNDANYLDAKLPLLFTLIKLLSSCRIVDGQLIKISLHAKNTIGRTVAEAIINLVSSLVLVNAIGIYGVLVGTILALLYRTNDIVLYVNRKILIRSAHKEYVLYFTNMTLFGLVVLIWPNPSFLVSGYFDLVLMTVFAFGGVGVSYFFVNLATNKDIRKMIREFYFKGILLNGE